MSTVYPYNSDERHQLRALLGAVDRWFAPRGFGVRSNDQEDTLLDAECAADALGMLGHWVARCGLPSRIVAPMLPVLVEKCLERLGDADDAQLATLAEIHREWIGHAEFDADDTARYVHKTLTDYAFELARAVDPAFTYSED